MEIVLIVVGAYLILGLIFTTILFIREGKDGKFTPDQNIKGFIFVVIFHAFFWKDLYNDLKGKK